MSWTAEHKEAPSGTYSVCIYDEEGFSALRKVRAQNIVHFLKIGSEVLVLISIEKLALK